ncbi:sulfatase-like hydrolase/transferase [Achromobacter sp. NCFB-sbj8-Ac1-l]|uniref:sulfatase-like hydrolase/transferase n=1 Tax=unclassified Achromobacter TaxID=2626865 RepID=UPI004046FC8E
MLDEVDRAGGHATAQESHISLRRAVAEVLVFVVYLLSLTWALHRYAEFDLGDPHWRIVAIVVALSPAMFLYLLLRLLMGALQAVGISVAAAALLIGINQTKTAYTGTPLAWGDIATTQNISIVLAYLSWWKIILVVMVVVTAGAALALTCRRAFARGTLRGRAFTAGLLLMVAPVAFQPYLPDAWWNANYKMQTLFARHGIYYTTGDWRSNVTVNGLFVHLVQTSRRPMPPRPSEAEWNLLHAIPSTPPAASPPKHVFFILCEACWYDENNFKDAFEPLRKLGFLPLRGISPAYGGGTVNASFEMLTAMPSHGALAGVVYQEYGLVMAPKTQTLASSLKVQGYETYALHNFTRTFWSRNIVLAKFGFDEFIGLEDMGYDGSGPFPRENILYNRVLDILNRNPDGKAFFNLETVYTHWPYPFNNDSGQGDYHGRLVKAIQDMGKFVEAVRVVSPDAVFMIYGDHKPALTKFFYERGVLPADMFVSTGAKAEDFVFQRFLDSRVLGDVPVWIGSGSRESETLKKMQQLGQHKPFYCLSAIFDQLFLGSLNPAARYAQRYICDQYDDNYLESAGKMPGWMYSAMLFHPDQVP